MIDEVMFSIRELSGQEYVDTYATKKAEGLPTEVAHVEAANGHGVRGGEHLLSRLTDGPLQAMNMRSHWISTGRGLHDEAGRQVTLVELCGMPVMSGVERALCRSLPWRLSPGVVPCAIGPTELRGEILELGSGSGAMAAELLERYPTIRVTATDVDPAMRAAATRRLERFGDRVRVQEADATRLPFGDASFDGVVSFIMLHHVIAWEDALAEVARAVAPPAGGWPAMTLMQSGPNRLLHRHGGATHRLASRGRVALPPRGTAPGRRQCPTRFSAGRSPDSAAKAHWHTTFAAPV